MNIHESYIKRCLELAKNSFPQCNPNPAVGAILVHDTKIIAEGFTGAYGSAHAEVNCIAFAKANTPELIKESTLYVSLEPCSHFGKTPPCSDLIIASNIKKVVIGTIDPFAKVAGSGIQRLKDAGVDVTVGILEEDCLELNKRFFTFHLKKRPYIILKWAQTKDGFIAPSTQHKQEPLWITNIFSRQLVHKWRSEEQAILIGARTALADNPSLTTRHWAGKSPVRVVLDPRESLSKNLELFNNKAKTISFNKEHPKKVCDFLFKEGLQSVLIEGGSKTLQRFIDVGLWDEARIFEGPVVFQNGTKAPELKGNYQFVSQDRIKSDLLTYFKNLKT